MPKVPLEQINKQTYCYCLQIHHACSLDNLKTSVVYETKNMRCGKKIAIGPNSSFSTGMLYELGYFLTQCTRNLSKQQPQTLNRSTHFLLQKFCLVQQDWWRFLHELRACTKTPVMQNMLIRQNVNSNHFPTKTSLKYSLLIGFSFVSGTYCVVWCMNQAAIFVQARFRWS